MVMNLKSLLDPWVHSVEFQLAEQFAYGHREVILDHLGLPRSLIIYGQLQHGFVVDPEQLNLLSWRKRRRDGRLHKLYLWSEETVNRLKKEGHKSVFSVASPWACVAHKAKRDETTVRQGSTLYFPSHSFHGAPFLHESLDFLMKRIQDSFNAREILVCLYWLDFINPTVRGAYESLGLETTCLGYRGSSAGDFPWVNIGGREKFLHMLLKTIQEADLVVFDEVSTAFWAACSLGKKVGLVRKTVHTNSYWNNKLNVESWENQKLLNYVTPMKMEPFETIDSTEKLADLARLHFGWEQVELGNYEFDFRQSKILSLINSD